MLDIVKNQGDNERLEQNEESILDPYKSPELSPSNQMTHPLGALK